MLALLYVFLYYRGSKCLFLSFFRVIVFQTLLPWWTFYTALFVYGNYLIKNQNMARIQGGHCPWSKIQGGRPTTLTPPCRAPAPPPPSLHVLLYFFDFRTCMPHHALILYIRHASTLGLSSIISQLKYYSHRSQMYQSFVNTAHIALCSISIGPISFAARSLLQSSIFNFVTPKGITLPYWDENEVDEKKIS